MSFRGVRSLVRRSQPAHGELDGSVRQFTPTFDFAHVRSVRIFFQKGPCLGASLVSRKRKRFAHETVRRASLSASHARGKVARSKRHGRKLQQITTSLIYAGQCRIRGLSGSLSGLSLTPCRRLLVGDVLCGFLASDRHQHLLLASRSLAGLLSDLPGSLVISPTDASFQCLH
jgi:hypothetical protein